ncbi:Ribose-5-phosphate isomerase A [Buchnera aphidicola (Tetraneura ulmi)]|uniref:ribose-5-phosphate isomerase RpiA n=1 Tax=Buchnera aphidicola TaxID=9 RepID=UPI003464D0A3
MNNYKLKELAAKSAIKYVIPNSIIGIGTGTTVSFFIRFLKEIKHLIQGAVSSSLTSSKLLRKIGIKLFDLNDVSSLSIYVDGADEINPKMQMIKGGGNALTKEKIIAAVAKKFICIIDENKQVKVLGKFPLSIEVIPMACSYVISELNKLGGFSKKRKNVITDNGNYIIEVHKLKILNPILMEEKINSIAGVVTVGIFAKRPADIVLIGSSDGLKTNINY